MKPMNPVLKFSGVAAIPAYIIFTFISHLFNTAINPLENWLSDYGNPILNPSGAFFYNLGCIVTALLLAVFYIGLTKWYRGGNTPKKYAICYICAQVSGLVAAVCLIMASLFPLGVNDALHKTFGPMNMIGINCFLSFTAVAVFLHPHVGKWIGVLGFFTSVFNIVTTNAFEDLFIAEWIYFLLFMVYIALITANYERFARPEADLRETGGAKAAKSIKS